MSLIDLHLPYYLQSHQHEYDLCLDRVLQFWDGLSGFGLVAMVGCAILKLTQDAVDRIEVKSCQ